MHPYLGTWILSLIYWLQLQGNEDKKSVETIIENTSVKYY